MPSQNSRRLFAIALFVAAAGVLAAVWWPGGKSEPPAPLRPVPRQQRSVLLVTTDTTRADHLEPYGAEDVETPVLQRLGASGAVFEAAYAVAPITLPSHTSILTGLYPPQHGVRNNGTHYVKAEVETLAERLSEEGYRTAAFVSAAVLERRYGLDQGFEVYDDDLSTGRERHPRMVADRPAEATIDAAIAWLATVEDGRRFFLWVHLYDPHAAYSPPPPFRDRYRQRLYDGEIAYMDSQIGRLLKHPRVARGGETIVAVLGDHGESLGEHREQTHGILAYDSTLHVPFILRVPGGPSGLRPQRPVSQVDLVPTLLDLLDLGPDAELPGQSLVPWLEGVRPQAQRALYSEAYLPFYTYGWAKLRVLRQGDFKYIEAPTPELYDLGRDPRELANQHDQLPGRAHDIRRALDELLAGAGDAEEEAQLELDSEAVEKLRSLGYLSVGSVQATDAERPDPKDVIELHTGLERARQLERNRLFDAAAKALRSVLSQDPNNLAALIDLASVLEQDGQVEEAVAVAERALSLDPGYLRLQSILARLEAKRGNGDRALELMRGALELEPRSLENRIQEVYLLVQLRRPKEARERVELALRDFPGHPKVELAYAQIVQAPGGDLEGAEATLRGVLEKDPFLVTAWRQLGQVLERRAQVVEAGEAFLEGLRRAPDDPELHGLLGLLLARRGDGQAADHLREAIRLTPEFRPQLHVALGGWLAERGRFDEAQHEYDQVLEVEPKHPGARNNRAIALYYSRRFEEAEAELLQLIAEFPNHPDAHNNLAAVSVDQGDWQRAEHHARRALELGAPAPQAWNNLGIAVDEQGRLEEALEAYRKALELEPLYWQARHNQGVVLGKQERWQAAAEAFVQVLEQVPEHPDTHYHLGDLYAGPLNRPELARVHWNTLLRHMPNHPGAADIRQRLARLPKT